MTLRIGQLLVLLVALSAVASAADSSDLFEKKVRPVLAAKCWSCHGAEKNKGGLRLHTAGGLAAGGDSGPVIVAGKPEMSPLIEVVNYSGDLKMPPKGKLSDAEIAALTEWVRSGAEWPNTETEPSPPPSTNSAKMPESPVADGSFWAFQPVVDPIPPVIEGNGPVKSPIDQFILKGLQAKGLRPAPPAEKRALIRRATFDLTGLPPTTSEIDAFLNDDPADAFAKVIDRLLASPAYGVRWGRHWLDLARYADSNGMDENVAYANAFRYRDYVIDAFNKDLPYDMFVREQIAGDLLPKEVDESTNFARMTATGFLVIGPKMLAEDDPMKMEMDIIDEQVDTVGRVFMGLTLGCARCHDHKFDPIPTNDYYSLAGIFKSTKSMANHKVVAMWNELPLAKKEESEAAEAHKAEFKRRDDAIKKRVNEARKDLRNEARGKVGEHLYYGKLWADARNLVRAAKPKAESTAGSLIIEAEAFQRGNVLIDHDNYGKGIGVILNKGELPNFVEYDIEIPADGAYQVEIRHAAQEARPIRLSIDGDLIKAKVAGEKTGSWHPEKQAWKVASPTYLKAGKHILRFDCEGPFPHLDKLAIVSPDLPEGFEAIAFKSPDQVGRETGLNARLIERWSEVLHKASEDKASIYRGLTDRGSLDGELKEAIDREPTPQSLKDVAQRYGELFAKAADAKPEDLKTDSVLAAFRKISDDKAGPLSVANQVENLLPSPLGDEVKKERASLAEFQKNAPSVSEAMGVEDQKVANLRVHIRGNHTTLGEEVPRRFPWVLAGRDRKPIDDEHSGRLELANWLAGPEHPLTARVMVNRVWQGHFGEGLVRSPDNFGKLGERPDHPELLEWLSKRFVEGAWSIKSLHKLIMLSATYQMGTNYDERAAQVDPENRLLWRMPRRRLEAEAIRDAILAVSGEIDLSMGGSSIPTKNHNYVNNTGGPGGLNYDVNRRSVYLPVIRSGLYSVFQAFDFADPSASNGHRVPTTVAPQALFMLNDKLVLRCSAELAKRLLARDGLDASGRIRHLYLTAYGRPATDAEVARGERYLKRFDAELAAENVASDQRPARVWQAFCQSILAASEFVYLD